jgi:hypothetical protein
VGVQVRVIVLLGLDWSFRLSGWGGGDTAADAAGCISPSVHTAATEARTSRRRDDVAAERERLFIKAPIPV